MVRLMMNNRPCEAEEGTTILDAATSVGIHIPTLCYMKELNEIGACRVCVVELEGKEKLVAACNNPVREGMVIYTNSPRVREARRTIVELILSQHDCYCSTCVRSGNCALQKIANDLGILDLPYKRELPVSDWNKKFPLIRDFSKCIKCMRCIQVCDKIQSMNIWDVANTGTRTTVDVTLSRKIENSDCTLCGQCITHCPVGALRERDDTEKAFAALADPDKITVVQVAPAVRAAWGEPFGLPREKATAKRLVSALRKMGFQYVFDTNFAADLTIMEESSELLEKLTHGGDKNYPFFTSCCPGWVRFLKSQYPDMVRHLSTAKSPQQMFGAVSKSYYAKLLQVDPSRIYSVSVMPCLAKKYESEQQVLSDAGAGQDVDLVLTTREIDRMIRSEHILVDKLEEDEFDTPLGVGTGAAVIFGATGGVMQAALRSAHFLATGENPDPDAFRELGGIKGWKEAQFQIGELSLRVAVVNGLDNTRRLMESIRAGKASYDFVEVMACPGGCAGGGGQPITEGMELAQDRGEMLHNLDRASTLRFSHENPAVIKVYQDYFGSPLSTLSHKLLHTNQNSWECPLSPHIKHLSPDR
jgi:NADP-reducing hydrogenase subunit HndD